MLLIKKFVLAFYNSFLKRELYCDKENHVNFEYMHLSKEDVFKLMRSNLFIDKMCSWR